jgi:hypothetical protein
MTGVNEIQLPISDASANQTDEVMAAKLADPFCNAIYDRSWFVNFGDRRMKSRFDDSR